MKTGELVRFLVCIFLCGWLVACSSDDSSTTALTVRLVNPTDNATNVAVNPTFQLQFNLPVNNVNSSTVTLHKGNVDGSAVAISAPQLGPNNTYTFRPLEALTPATVYYLVAGSGITTQDFPKIPNSEANFRQELVSTTFSFTTAVLWTTQVGAPGGDTEAFGISVDSAGNSYVTGRTSVGISGQPQINNICDYFIAQYDSSGTLKWAKQVGSTSPGNNNQLTIGTDVDVDKEGNSYVVGQTRVGLSGQEQHGYSDYFIAKYDANGTLVWGKQVGTGPNGDTEAWGIRVDRFGNSYMTGYTNVGISKQTQQGNSDYFIAKYDSSGVLKWTKQVGTSGGVTGALGISIDDLGNSYIVGYTKGGISGEMQKGGYDYFIAKHDADGTLKWTKQVGVSGGSTFGEGIDVDNAGNIYVTGDTNVSLFGQKTQQGDTDYFIAKYNANGQLQWGKQVGASGGDAIGTGVAVDRSGNSYVTGFSNVSLSGQPQRGGYFLAKYTPDGNLEWTQMRGLGGGTATYGVALDGSDNVYIAGTTLVGINGEKQNGLWDYLIVKN